MLEITSRTESISNVALHPVMYVYHIMRYLNICQNQMTYYSLMVCYCGLCYITDIFLLFYSKKLSSTYKLRNQISPLNRIVSRVDKRMMKRKIEYLLSHLSIDSDSSGTSKVVCLYLFPLCVTHPCQTYESVLSDNLRCAIGMDITH